VLDDIILNMERNGLNLAISEGLDIDYFVELMLRDKKSSHDELNLVMLLDIEKQYVNDGFYFYKTSPMKVKEFIIEFMSTYKHKTSDLIKFLDNEN